MLTIHTCDHVQLSRTRAARLRRLIRQDYETYYLLAHWASVVVDVGM